MIQKLHFVWQTIAACGASYIKMTSELNTDWLNAGLMNAQHFDNESDWFLLFKTQPWLKCSDLTRVCCDEDRASKISSTIRSDRKDARLSFTSLTERKSSVWFSQDKEKKSERINGNFAAHTPDFIDNIHPWLLQEGFCDKAFRYCHPCWTSLHQLWTKITPLHHMGTQRLRRVHHGL